jgi:hypothetical protein
MAVPNAQCLVQALESSHQGHLLIESVCILPSAFQHKKTVLHSTNGISDFAALLPTTIKHKMKMTTVSKITPFTKILKSCARKKKPLKM